MPMDGECSGVFSQSGGQKCCCQEWFKCLGLGMLECFWEQTSCNSASRYTTFLPEKTWAV